MSKQPFTSIKTNLHAFTNSTCRIFVKDHLSFQRVKAADSESSKRKTLKD